MSEVPLYAVWLAARDGIVGGVLHLSLSVSLPLSLSDISPFLFLSLSDPPPPARYLAPSLSLFRV